MGFAKRVLQRTRRAVGPRQPLYRGDLAAVGLHREHEAGAHRLTVEQHRARAADAVLASGMGAGQAQGVAQEIDQGQTPLHPGFAQFAVHFE